jgi:cysteine synthase A
MASISEDAIEAAVKAALDSVGHGPDVSSNDIFKCGILSSIGNTPLIELTSLSAATGCRILGKAEFLNPGGSVKDRTALRIIAEAESMGLLSHRGLTPEGRPYTVVEGTGGNTGIGLALVAARRGYALHAFAPENCSMEKVNAAKAYGAEVTVCPSVPFGDPTHYYQRSEARAREPGCVLGNQFEGLANTRAHITTTAPEILRQTGGRVDAVALSAGTGGSIAGLSLVRLPTRSPHDAFCGVGIDYGVH